MNKFINKQTKLHGVKHFIWIPRCETYRFDTIVWFIYKPFFIFFFASLIICSFIKMIRSSSHIVFQWKWILWLGNVYWTKVAHQTYKSIRIEARSAPRRDFIFKCKSYDLCGSAYHRLSESDPSIVSSIHLISIYWEPNIGILRWN